LFFAAISKEVNCNYKGKQMLNIKYSLGVALVLGLTPISALAQDMDWSGAYVGASLGYGSANHDIDVATDLLGPNLNANLPDLGGEGFVGSLHAGYSQQFDKFILGVQIDGTLGNIENDTSLSFGGDNLDYTLAMTDMYTLSLRGGYLVNSETQMYGLVGYSRGNFDGDLTSSVGLNADYSFEMDGVTIGAGLETLVTDAISLGIEYRMTQFEDYNLISAGVNSVDLETNVQTVQVFMNYRF
jgi:outer membrane immunogenic protein